MRGSISPADLAARLTALPRTRQLIAIAGAPGSGKSTLAETLVEMLNRAHPHRAAILPMDGYHFDDLVLEPRGLRPRKGAPQTFDVGGLAQMLARLRANDEAEIAVPVFDRAIEIARAGARMISREVELVLVEGNYLLLDRPPWNCLAEAFDMSVFVDVPEAELTRRLTARWQGYDLTPDQIRAKLDENDLPNGALVRTHLRPPDHIIDGTHTLKDL